MNTSSHHGVSAVLLLVFLSCFVAVVVLLFRIGWTRRKHHDLTSSAVPLLPPGCQEFDASCSLPCPECHRMASDGCTHCERPGRPRCCPLARSTAAAVNVSSSRASIRWLHFPKCGATLAISVLAYACADSVPAWHAAGMALRGGRIDVRMALSVGAHHASHGARCGGQLLLPFEGHRPVAPFRGARSSSSSSLSSSLPSSPLQRALLAPRRQPRDASGLVTIFRRPSQRLISAYLDNYHAWGLKPSLRRTLKQRAPTIAAFARFPGVAGCMAKMLAGHQCAADVSLNDGRIVRQALAVLRSPRLIFIGLAEQWEASICLMHRMLPGHSRPLLAEFRQLGHSTNSHRAISWLPPSRVDGEYNESVLEGFMDEADEAVYAEAERIFRRNLARALSEDEN